MTAVETADGHCSARCQGQRHHEQIMWMMYTLNTVWQKERFTSVSLLLKTHSPGLIMRKTAAKLHRRGILQHTRPARLRTVKVIKHKESLWKKNRFSLHTTSDTKQGGFPCQDLLQDCRHQLDFLHFNSTRMLQFNPMLDLMQPPRLRAQSHKTTHHFRCQLQVIGLQVTHTSFCLTWLQIEVSQSPLLKFDNLL